MRKAGKSVIRVDMVLETYLMSGLRRAVPRQVDCEHEIRVPVLRREQQRGQPPSELIAEHAVMYGEIGAPVCGRTTMDVRRRAVRAAITSRGKEDAKVTKEAFLVSCFSSFADQSAGRALRASLSTSRVVSRQLSGFLAMPCQTSPCRGSAATQCLITSSCCSWIIGN